MIWVVLVATAHLANTSTSNLLVSHPWYSNAGNVIPAIPHATISRWSSLSCLMISSTDYLSRTYNYYSLTRGNHLGWFRGWYCAVTSYMNSTPIKTHLNSFLSLRHDYTPLWLPLFSGESCQKHISHWMFPNYRVKFLLVVYRTNYSLPYGLKLLSWFIQ